MAYPTNKIRFLLRSISLTIMIFASSVFSSTLFGQQFHICEMHPVNDTDNITVKSLSNDANSSSFIIWIDNKVADHYHAEHTELIYVLEGKAKMRLGTEQLLIEKGDFISIDPGMIHGVEVTSRRKLKVLSIQSPEFKGKDRIFVKEE